MSTPEIRVGQKWRVVDAEEFGFQLIKEGEVLTVQRFVEPNKWYFDDHIFMYSEEAVNGTLEIVEDTQEPPEFAVYGGERCNGDIEYVGVTEASQGESEDVSELSRSEVPEVVETRIQSSTGSPTGMSGELLWKFIEGSSEYNGHKQLEINEMSFDVLKETVRIVSEHVTEHVGTLADILEIRLSYNGDAGEFAGTWGASVYQNGYWKAGDHLLGHTDRLLFGIEVVRGI